MPSHPGCRHVLPAVIGSIATGVVSWKKPFTLQLFLSHCFIAATEKERMQVLWSTRCWTRLEDGRWRGENSGAPNEVVIEVLDAGLCVESSTFGHWPWLRDNECISCRSNPRKVKRARNATSDSGYGQTSIGRMTHHLGAFYVSINSDIPIFPQTCS